MSIFDFIHKFLAPEASSIAASNRPCKSGGAFPKVPDGASGIIARVMRRRETRMMTKELATCHAAMLRFNRAAIVASLGSTIAHELGQPLATIVSHARAGQRWLTGARSSLQEAGHSLAEIESAAWRASAIVESMRTLITADVVGHAVFELNQMVGDTFRILGERNLDTDVTRQRILTPEPLWVRGDQIQIQQVLLNLVVNATQAMLETSKPAQLTVQVRSARRLVLLEVSDTGPGIRPDELARIFEPLYTTKPGGVGMGLAICRQIAEIHGGALDARSPQEGGAVFTLSLPQVSAPSHPLHAPNPPGQALDHDLSYAEARP